MNFIVWHNHWETKQFKLWAEKKKSNDDMSLIDGQTSYMVVQSAR